MESTLRSRSSRFVFVLAGKFIFHVDVDSTNGRSWI